MFIIRRCRFARHLGLHSALQPLGPKNEQFYSVDSHQMPLPSSTASVINFQHIRVLSLDAMNTLIKFREPVGVVYSRLFDQAGLRQHLPPSASITPDFLEQRFRAEFRHLERTRPCYAFNDGGFISWWAELLRRTFAGVDPNLNLPPSFIRDVIDYYRTGQAWELIHPNFITDFEHLTRARPDLSIVITSNFDSRLRQILDHFDLQKFIASYFLSGELGFQKPGQQIFRTVAEYFRLNGQMDRILHVGDSPDLDFVACRFGVQTLLYDPLPKSEKDAEADVFGRQHKFRVASQYRIASLSDLFHHLIHSSSSDQVDCCA